MSPLGATRDIRNDQNNAQGNDTREPKLSINKYELSKNTLASTAGASSSSITHSKAEAATLCINNQASYFQNASFNQYFTGMIGDF
ncbi:hypothetical protein CEXT_432621 [Caerostris extrusa]|uniref:Uncharacterized protein n=1 Tax=Caerostris extrusa TaxID=172846 RepID=A0AAV4UCR2_CAEEX|nr:hypothetical protein CEXT_432621 [Caerostris extrusa]